MLGDREVSVGASLRTLLDVAETARPAGGAAADVKAFAPFWAVCPTCSLDMP